MRKMLLFVAIASALSYGCREKDCADSDYDCNYRAFLKDIQAMPPDYRRAALLAINSNDIFTKNIQHVLETKDDYVSTALLKVLDQHDVAIKRRVCMDPLYIEPLRKRGEQIAAAMQRYEYSRNLEYVCGEFIHK